MRARALSCAAALAALAACRTARPPRDEPAVIVDPTDGSRAALRRAVSGALRGAPVTLADDALTRSSTLVIEPLWPRDAAGRRLGGREQGLPERFHLVRSGGRCVLVRDRDGRRLALEGTSCAPAPAAPATTGE
ncbi:MAG TPA: hypothetical protein VF841_11855 [Anaeromyxobacter sp.]